MIENNCDGDACDADLGSEREVDDGHGGCSEDDNAGGGTNSNTDDDADRRVHAYGEGDKDGEYDDVRVGNADDCANHDSEADGVRRSYPWC